MPTPHLPVTQVATPTPRALLAALAAIAGLLGAAAPAQAADGKALADSLVPLLSRTAGVDVTKATCPAVVTPRKGGRTTCQVSYASGDRTPVRVTFKDDRGNYDAKAVYFLMRAFEQQLERTLEDKGVVSVTCPKARRKIRKGDRFTCRGVDTEGDKGTFHVRQTGRGYAKYTVSG